MSGDNVEGEDGPVANKGQGQEYCQEGIIPPGLKYLAINQQVHQLDK